MQYSFPFISIICLFLIFEFEGDISLIDKNGCFWDYIASLGMT